MPAFMVIYTLIWENPDLWGLRKFENFQDACGAAREMMEEEAGANIFMESIEIRGRDANADP